MKLVNGWIESATIQTEVQDEAKVLSGQPLNMKSDLAKLLSTTLQDENLEGGSYHGLLCKNCELFYDFAVMSIGTQIQEKMKAICLRSHGMNLEQQSLQMLKCSLWCLDKATGAPKTSHESHFWFQVYAMLVACRRDTNTSTDTRIMTAIMMQVFSELMINYWATRIMKNVRENELKKKQLSETPVMQQKRLQDIETKATSHWNACAADVNRFFGFALKKIMQKYVSNMEEYDSGNLDGYGCQEDVIMLLVDMCAKERNVINNTVYMNVYHQPVDQVFNMGGLTLVDPKYVSLAHKIIFEISCQIDEAKIIEEKEDCIKKARETVNQKLEKEWLKEFMELTRNFETVSETTKREILEGLRANRKGIQCKSCIHCQEV